VHGVCRQEVSIAARFSEITLTGQ
jgi:hypothetical protein